MPQWYAMDAGVGGHRRVQRLGARLGLPTATVVGGLGLFWARVRQDAPDGQLVGWTLEDVDRATTLGLVGVGRAMCEVGLLDGEPESDQWRVHNWKARNAIWLKDAARKRQQRADAKAESPRTVPGRSTDGPQTVRATEQTDGTDLTDTASSRSSTPSGSRVGELEGRDERHAVAATAAPPPRLARTNGRLPWRALRPRVAELLPTLNRLIREPDEQPTDEVRALLADAYGRERLARAYDEHPSLDVLLVACKLLRRQAERATYRNLPRALGGWLQAAEDRGLDVAEGHNGA